MVFKDLERKRTYGYIDIFIDQIEMGWYMFELSKKKTTKLTF